MPPQAIALKALASVSTLFLIGFMFVLRAVTQDLYAQWGPGLSHPTMLANAMTVLPVPLIAFMARLVVASPEKGAAQVRRTFRFARTMFTIQACFFISIPILLAFLEGVLNAGAIIMSLTGASFALVLALLFAIASSNADIESAGEIQYEALDAREPDSAQEPEPRTWRWRRIAHCSGLAASLTVFAISFLVWLFGPDEGMVNVLSRSLAVVSSAALIAEILALRIALRSGALEGRERE